MNVSITQHFDKRANERYDKNKDYIIKTFKYLIKLIKKGKLRPEKGNTEGVYVIRYDDLKFVYAKKDKDYTLITFGKRTFNY